MNDFTNFLSGILKNRVDDLATIFLVSSFFLTSLYWLNTRLEKIIQSPFLRRNTVALTLILLFVVYYIGTIWSQPINFKHYMQTLFVQLIIAFLSFNLFHFIISNLIKKDDPKLRFMLMFFVFSSTMFFSYWLIYTIDNNRQNYSESDLAGRFHFFKKQIFYYYLMAFEVSIIDAAFRYITKLQEYKKKVKELETFKLKEQLTKAQLDALHSKVNPHFLYNSLNSIAGLALTDGQKTKQMAMSLSKFFRYSINHKEDNLISVGEELEMTETYLKIEQIRFEERLNYEIIVAPETEEIKIPRFILQPLAENSVKHGMKENELFIRINVQLEGKKLCISIGDNGLPFADDFKPGYGLKSIYDKLDILFPEKYEVSLFNEPVKQVRILIKT